MVGQERRESEATSETEELLEMLWREPRDLLATPASPDPRGRMASQVSLATPAWLG